MIQIKDDEVRITKCKIAIGWSFYSNLKTNKAWYSGKHYYD